MEGALYDLGGGGGIQQVAVHLVQWDPGPGVFQGDAEVLIKTEDYPCIGYFLYLSQSITSDAVPFNLLCNCRNVPANPCLRAEPFAYCFCLTASLNFEVSSECVWAYHIIKIKELYSMVTKGRVKTDSFPCFLPKWWGEWRGERGCDPADIWLRQQLWKHLKFVSPWAHSCLSGVHGLYRELKIFAARSCLSLRLVTAWFHMLGMPSRPPSKSRHYIPERFSSKWS